MGCLRVTAEFTFTPSPAGFRLLSALETFVRPQPFDLVLTAGSNGIHSGPLDPHYRGDAYDVRTHTLGPGSKLALVRGVLECLAPGVNLVPASIGYAADLWYAQLEDPGGPNEHLHVQLRHGCTYPASAPPVGTIV